MGGIKPQPQATQVGGAMAQPQYSAGFHFIVGNSAQSLKKADRRAISSHATRAQGRRRKAAQLRSWIGPDRILGLMDMESPLSGALLSPTSSPKPTGGDFSALQLPQGVEPVMIQDLAKIINLDIRACIHTRSVSMSTRRSEVGSRT